MRVTDEQRHSWERDGFFRIEGFAEPAVCDAMLDRVIDIARRFSAGERVAPALITPEQNLRAEGRSGQPEDLVSKIFRLHRDTVFHEFAVDQELSELMASLLDVDDITCFLSQFIFKN